MATLSLKISVVGGNVVKTMQFEPSTIVFDACRMIRERIAEANADNRKYCVCNRHIQQSDVNQSSCSVHVSD